MSLFKSKFKKAEPPDPDYFYKKAQDYGSSRFRLPGKYGSKADEKSYNLEKYYAVKKDFEGLDKKYYLMKLLDKIKKEDKDIREGIIKFLQGAFYHNPVQQPVDENGNIIQDPVILLNLHEGRCGHVAAAAKALFEIAGYKARIVQLKKHIVCEFFDKGWHLADADLFKNGIIPKDEKGNILSVKEILDNPYVIDKYPPTGLIVKRGSIYSKNSKGEIIDGYVDYMEFDKRGYPGNFYSGKIDLEYPPKIVENLRHKIEKGNGGYDLFLNWNETSDPDNDFDHYLVSVGKTSKGWSYNSLVYKNIINETGKEAGEFKVKENSLKVSVKDKGEYFWSVKAIDNHVKKEPQTYYFSSDEDKIII